MGFDGALDKKKKSGQRHIHEHDRGQQKTIETQGLLKETECVAENSYIRDKEHE